MTRAAEARRREALGSLVRFRDVPTQVAGLYEERARAIRQAFAAGASISAIADKLGIARKVVYDAVRGGASNGSTR